MMDRKKRLGGLASARHPNHIKAKRMARYKAEIRARAILKKNGWELVGKYRGMHVHHVVRKPDGLAYQVKLNNLLFKLQFGDNYKPRFRIPQHDKGERLMSNTITINIKPMSVNRAYKGRKYKTPGYTGYTEHILLCLNAYTPPDIDFKKPFGISYTFGMSSRAGDVDNPVKPLQDILSRKYGFNDNMVYEIRAYKRIVPKEQEFVSCHFYQIDENI